MKKFFSMLVVLIVCGNVMVQAAPAKQPLAITSAITSPAITASAVGVQQAHRPVHHKRHVHHYRKHHRKPHH